MKHFINRIADVFVGEIKTIFKDEGVMMFVILVPIFYPLLYSWIYNNELPHEVEVVVVDQSKGNLSRQMIRDIDASSDVHVVAFANDLAEARSMVGRHEAYGVVLFPSDFDRKVGRMEQSTVLVYTDMSYMLAYKAIYQTLTTVSLELGNEVKRSLMGAYTSRDEELSLTPIEVHDVPMFNPQGGYGSFILPPVLILIIQQTMLLGVGLTSGTYAERRRQGLSTMNCGLGLCEYEFLPRAVCYLMIYAVAAAYLVFAVPHFFSFLQLAQPQDLIWFIVPLLFSCVAFASLFSCLIKRREEVMIMVVFTSVPFLMLSGVSWPQSNIPAFWKTFSYLIPSTFGIQGFVKLNSLGATRSMVMPEYTALWIQTAIYGVLAFVANKWSWRNNSAKTASNETLIDSHIGD